MPGPEGRTWRDTTIRGHAARGTGILRNQLYVGRLIWNRMRFIKDPAMGKRVSRLNPSSAWIVEEVPELRIIDADLWDRVQARLEGIRESSGANDPGRKRWWEQRRAQHLLSGKCFCGVCGGAFTNVGRDYLACSAARKQGTCTNSQGIRRAGFDAMILYALRTQLMQPDLVAEFVSAFTEEWNRLQSERSAVQATQQRELETVRRRLAGLIDAIADGMRAPGLQQKLDELEGRKAALEAELAGIPAPAPRLMPNLGIWRRFTARRWRSCEAFGGAGGTEALGIVRGLIEKVMLTPGAGGKGLEIELTGEVAAMVALGQGLPPGSRADRALFDRSVSVVAGTGFDRQLTALRVAC